MNNQDFFSYIGRFVEIPDTKMFDPLEGKRPEILCDIPFEYDNFILDEWVPVVLKRILLFGPVALGQQIKWGVDSLSLVYLTDSPKDPLFSIRLQFTTHLRLSSIQAMMEHKAKAISINKIKESNETQTQNRS